MFPIVVILPIFIISCVAHRAIYWETDEKEGDSYTLVIDQVGNLKEENKRLKMEKQMLDTKRKA